MAKAKKNKGGRGKEVESAKIDRRRQRVFEMRAKGLSVSIIAEALNVTTRTVDNDIAALKTDTLEWLNKSRKNFPADEYWIDRKGRLEMRFKEMWVAISEQKTDRSSVSREMRDLEIELESILRKMGIITTKVDPENLVTDTIRIIHETR